MPARKQLKPGELSKFEGKDVRRSTIAITNAGDGLSESLKVEPVEIHQGDRGFLVLEWECSKVGFVPVDKDSPGGDQVRVQTLRAGAALIVDDDLVSEMMTAHKERMLKAREEAAGIQRLEYDGEADDDGALDDEPEPEAPAKRGRKADG